MKIILSCEHGGNEIPRPYQYLFNEAGEVLKTHRGYDLGALDLFEHVKGLSDFSQACTISRLLIETNRSLHHSQLFSKYTRQLHLTEKKNIIEKFYLPYRTKIERPILQYISAGDEVIHISVHSFTPVLNDKVRTADIGILYDPSRTEEKDFANDLRKKILEQQPEIRVRSNYPYLGTADGFTSWLRKKFPQNYAGIELEINQKFSTANKMDEKIKRVLYKSISELKKTSLF